MTCGFSMFGGTLVEVLSDIYSVLFFFKVDWKQIGSRQASGNMAKYCESC